jgi:hypothetical protein
MAGSKVSVGVGYSVRGLQCLPEKVPLPETRNARKGRVRPLNAGYRRDAA